MESTDDLRESLGICVSYLCARLEELEESVNVNDIHIDARQLKELVAIGRDLTAACLAIEETIEPQDLVVRFTNSESEPQDIV